MVSQSVGFNVGRIYNLVLFMGLFSMSASSVGAIPIQTSVGDGGGTKYPINIACECIFTLYVDGVYIGEGNKENYDPIGWPFGRSEWNDTKKYYPIIYENGPKIVAFNGMGGQYPVFPNGFIMDINDGKDYTKYKEWRCKDFSKTIEKSPPANWFAYDYDDSGWDISTSYGANYQNNSYQIFESPRQYISLNAEWLWTKDNSDANIYCRKKNIATSALTSMPMVSSTSLPMVTSAPMVTSLPVVTSAPVVTSSSVVTSAPMVTSLSVVTSAPMVTSLLASTSTVGRPPVSTTIHSPVRTHPPASTLTVERTHPPASTLTVERTHPPASTTIHSPVRTHPPASTSTVGHSHTPVSTTIHSPVRTHPPSSTSTVVRPHTPVSTTIHSPVRTHRPALTSTVERPPVSTTIHSPVRTHLPASTSTVERTHLPASTSTVVHPPVSTTIHSPVRTHRPASTSTMERTHPPASTSTVERTHLPTSTSTVVRPHTPVSTTIHAHPSINIKIVINNIKYSKGISDKQVAHLLENVKFYNQNQYYNQQRENNNLYRTVLTTRIDLIRHYEILIRHLERLERYSHEEDTDNKLPRHSSNDSTSKYNIIQSMIKLNSRIKQIENSIHFIKGNHKYLLQHILNNLKQQYKKDTMKIFNI
jgi:deleted-in-malignant-brain-tumors protein 1